MQFGSVYTELFSPENRSRDDLASAKFAISCQNSVHIDAVSPFKRQINRAVFKTLHFWQRFQIDAVLATVSNGVV